MIDVGNAWVLTVLDAAPDDHNAGGLVELRFEEPTATAAPHSHALDSSALAAWNDACVAALRIVPWVTNPPGELRRLRPVGMVRVSPESLGDEAPAPLVAGRSGGLLFGLVWYAWLTGREIPQGWLATCQLTESGETRPVSGVRHKLRVLRRFHPEGALHLLIDEDQTNADPGLAQLAAAHGVTLESATSLRDAIGKVWPGDHPQPEPGDPRTDTLILCHLLSHPRDSLLTWRPLAERARARAATCPSAPLRRILHLVEARGLGRDSDPRTCEMPSQRDLRSVPVEVRAQLMIERWLQWAEVAGEVPAEDIAHAERLATRLDKRPDNVAAEELRLLNAYGRWVSIQRGAETSIALHAVLTRVWVDRRAWPDVAHTLTEWIRLAGIQHDPNDGRTQFRDACRTLETLFEYGRLTREGRAYVLRACVRTAIWLGDFDAARAYFDEIPPIENDAFQYSLVRWQVRLARRSGNSRALGDAQARLDQLATTGRNPRLAAPAAAWINLDAACDQADEPVNEHAAAAALAALTRIDATRLRPYLASPQWPAAATAIERARWLSRTFMY
jgi:hypothetical protein